MTFLSSPGEVRTALPRLSLSIRLGAVEPFLLPLGLLAVWQASGDLGLLSDRLMPTPLGVLTAFGGLMASGELPGHIGVSALRAVAGLMIGGSIGFALGLLNGASGRSFRLTDTLVQMIRNIPHLALIPLVIVWFGIGEQAKLFLVALGVFFPIYLNTLHGVRNVDPQLVEMAQAYGMTSRDLFRRVILPGALPSIFVGLRYALGIMWLTLIVAETLSASSGLGFMAMQAREFMLLDVVMLAILLYALLGKLADVTARSLEHRMLRWHPAYATGVRP